MKNKALKADVKAAAKRAKGLASLQSEQQQKRKEARVEKEELAKTADSELLRRKATAILPFDKFNSAAKPRSYVFVKSRIA